MTCLLIAALLAGMCLLSAAAEVGSSAAAVRARDIFSVCGDPYSRIHDVQGSGSTSPLAGQAHTLEGVVTMVRNASGQLGGFFLQSLAGDVDADETTSEGIFIFTGANPPYSFAQGDHIRVSGTVTEYNSPASSYGQMYSMTQLYLVSSLEVCASTALPAPAEIRLPIPGDPADYLERFEGMLVRISAEEEGLFVQQNYFQGRFGQLTIAAGGEYGRLFHPNNGNNAMGREDNLRTLLILDDGSHSQNPNPIPYYPSDGALRAGSPVEPLVGLLDQGRINSAPTTAADFTAAFPYVHYRLHPLESPVFPQEDVRSAHLTPPDVDGSIRVAYVNVMNYFTTLNNGRFPSGSPYSSAAPPRGANTQTELERQTDKLVAALQALDADILALVELEAWAPADAAGALTEALNHAIGSQVYALVPEPPGFPQPPDGDFIKVGMLYKPQRLTLAGSPQMDNHEVYSRVPLAQTFQDAHTSRRFSVVVNHFKSRSGCPDSSGDANADHGQGCWNTLRVEQALRLLDFVRHLAGESGIEGVLVLGDLNAYALEDPLEVLEDGGLLNLVTRYIDPASRYSYVFDGQAGYLDHALATAGLAAHISGSAFWHINADEPAVIDYNTEYKPVDFFQPHPFRSSDHDPLVIGLEFRGRVFLPLIRR